ncbi:MAG: hypothetical protein WCA93_03405 [Acidimicrobiia bacterium]
MKNQGRLITVTVVMVLLVASCGGGTSGSTLAGEAGAKDATTTVTSSQNDEPGGDTETTTDQSDKGSPGGTAANGTVMVDGEAFDAAQMYRCVPYADPGKEPNPEDLDLVVFATDGRYLSLTISNGEGVNMGNGQSYPRQAYSLRLDVADAGGQVEYELGATNDEDGNWILGDDVGTPLDSAPFIIDGNNISGGMTLVETYPNEGDSMVNVTYELEIPGDVVDCSAG